MGGIQIKKKKKQDLKEREEQDIQLNLQQGGYSSENLRIELFEKKITIDISIHLNRSEDDKTREGIIIDF